MVLSFPFVFLHVQLDHSYLAWFSLFNTQSLFFFFPYKICNPDCFVMISKFSAIPSTRSVKFEIFFTTKFWSCLFLCMTLCHPLIGMVKQKCFDCYYWFFFSLSKIKIFIYAQIMSVICKFKFRSLWICMSMSDILICFGWCKNQYLKKTRTKHRRFGISSVLCLIGVFSPS